MRYELPEAMMMTRGCFLLFCVTFFIYPSSFIPTLRARETPESLAKKLQEQFLAAQGVSLAFDLADEGRITIETDLHTGRIRIESPAMLILSDGHTVWNYQKREDRVTIDNTNANSAFKDPASLFRFADNYTARITKWDGTMLCTLELSPLPKLLSLLKAAGEIQNLSLELQIKKQGLKIMSATATSSKGAARAEKLTINTVHHVRDEDFVFKPRPSTKVIDLRE